MGAKTGPNGRNQFPLWGKGNQVNLRKWPPHQKFAPIVTKLKPKLNSGNKVEPSEVKAVFETPLKLAQVWPKSEHSKVC